MEVVFHDGIGEQVDRKAASCFAQFAFEAASATSVVATLLVLAQQEQSADASVHGMNDSLLSGRKTSKRGLVGMGELLKKASNTATTPTQPWCGFGSI